MKFISPKTDFAFKKIFGSSESKNILISFLNALIYEEKPRIEDLEIINPYSSGNSYDLKDTYLDVKAKLSNHTMVIIEMQILNVAAFEKRIVYNAAKTYSNQLKRGEGYLKLKPVIALTITDFIMFSHTEDVINRFMFMEKDKKFSYKDSAEIQLIFVELPKFNKTLDEIETLLEKWLFFIKNTPDLEVIPSKLGEIPELNQALQIANQSNLTIDELEDLDKREIWLQDQKGVTIKAKEEGLQLGLQQGIKQGQIAIVINLLLEKFGEIPIETREKIEDLSSEEIPTLISKIFQTENINQLF